MRQQLLGQINKRNTDQKSTTALSKYPSKVLAVQ